MSDPLVPRWYAFTVTGVLLVAVAALKALLLPRRRRELRPARDGSLTITSPASVVWPLLGAWALLLVVAALWCIIGVADPGAIEAPVSPW